MAAPGRCRSPVPSRRTTSRWRGRTPRRSPNSDSARSRIKNDQQPPGHGPVPRNAVNGVRINTGIAYINPHRQRPNLTIRGNTLARKVVFNGTRATGLEVETNGQVETIGAGQIVLSAGAFNSPHLLLLSGIGPAAELTAATYR